MRPRAQTPRHAKLPPILEIDEYGVPIAEMNLLEGRRWTTDDDEPGVRLAEWSAEFDD